MLWDLWTNSAGVALLGMLVSLAAVAMALAYAIKPDERRLALMRPLSLAAIFGGLSSFTAGVATILQGISATGTFTVGTFGRIAAGAAESVVGLFVAMGCLTIAWLLVALGLWRTEA
jgi:hypothetical protein